MGLDTGRAILAAKRRQCPGQHERLARQLGACSLDRFGRHIHPCRPQTVKQLPRRVSCKVLRQCLGTDVAHIAHSQYLFAAGRGKCCD